MFLPAICVFSGGLLAAGGTLWAAFRQSASSADLQQKNRQIYDLQQQNILLLKGGSALHVMVMYEPDDAGNCPIIAINNSGLPVYDVKISYFRSDGPMTTLEEQQAFFKSARNPQVVDVGTVPSGASDLPIRLSPGRYQLTIRTRYLNITELMSFGHFGGTYGQSFSAQDWSGKIIVQQTSPEGYKAVY